MSKNKAMAQLLRVRHLEEDQCRLRLESALAEELLHERALERTLQRERELRAELGRAITAAGAGPDTRLGEGPGAAAGAAARLSTDQEMSAAMRAVAGLGAGTEMRADAGVARHGALAHTRMGAATDSDGWMLERRAIEAEKQRNAKTAELLRSRLAELRQNTAGLRAGFVEARVRRMQVESVLNAEAALEAQQEDRRQQRSLDDWFGSRFAQSRVKRTRV